MRAILLTLALAASASAQITFDVVGSGGAAMTSAATLPLPAGPSGFGAVSVSVAPGLPLGTRLMASATVGPGNGESRPGSVAAVGVGAEVPFSGGRNGVYLAVGGALLDFDNADADGVAGCNANPDCMDETGDLFSHTGLAATVGLGARVPVVSRFWVEPSVSAFVYDSGALPSAQIGVGWRIR